jgi:type VI secretion system secreted protein VgrG
LEQEGMFYFFESGNGSEQLVISDDSRGTGDLGTLQRRKRPSQSQLPGDSIFGWRRYRRQGPGRYLVRHVSTAKPATTVKGSSPSAIKSCNGNTALRGWEEAKDGRQAQRIAQLRMEAVEAGARTAAGHGNACAMAPGHRFRFQDQQGNARGSYFITEVRHFARQGKAGVASHYENGFECIDAKTAFRPARTTRPASSALKVKLATVVDAKGNRKPTEGKECVVNEHGEVHVRFVQDGANAKKAHSFCVPVMHPPGSTFTPRVGETVCVLFLDGDPDLPIVIGCVRNQGTLPVKTKTHPLRGVVKPSNSGNGNEIRLEDDENDPYVALFAKGSLYEQTKQSRHATVDQNDIAKIGGGRHLTVHGNVSEAVGGDASESVGGSKLVRTADCYIQARGHVLIDAGRQITLQVGGNKIVISAGGVSVDAALLKLLCAGCPPAPPAPELIEPEKPETPK